MLRTICAGFLVSVLGGCDSSRAINYDSSNPARCLAIFGLASVGAAAKGDQRLSREMQDRQFALVKEQGGSDWLNKIAPASIQFAAQLESDKDDRAIGTLLQECKERHSH